VRHLFKCSRWLHKYSGLLFLIYFAAMGVSGTLLNHPQWIDKLSISSTFIPASHQLDNGRRMAIRDSVVDGDNIYIAGRAGVWHSSDNGQHFSKLERNFPQSSYLQESYCLLLDPARPQGQPAYLLAGTRTGLYRYDFKSQGWSQLHLAHEPLTIVDLVATDQHILALSTQHCFRSLATQPTLGFTPIELTFAETAATTHTALHHLLLRLHDGTLFGQIGRTIVDICGGLLLFLSLSGLLIWYLPWSNRRSRKQRIFLKVSWWYRYHLKVGIYAAFFIALITLSGILIRPPFIATIKHISVANGPLWQAETPRIDKGFYHLHTDTVFFATRKGIFSTTAHLDRPFTLDARMSAIPMSTMGTTVFKPLNEQHLVIASFRGAYLWNFTNQQLEKIPLPPRTMATSAVIEKEQLRYIVDYRRGLIATEPNEHWQLPDAMNDTPISLWLWLFELHNGRLFRQWLGLYTGWIIPIGGLLLLLNLLSGCFDWWWHRRRRNHRNRK